MKTKKELEALTKKGLIEHAATLGASLSMRNNKDALVKAILHLQRGNAPTEGTVSVTLTRCPSSGGMPLTVNGRRFFLPLGKPVELPAWALPTLEQVADITFTKG